VPGCRPISCKPGTEMNGTRQGFAAEISSYLGRRKKEKPINNFNEDLVVEQYTLSVRLARREGKRQIKQYQLCSGRRDTPTEEEGKREILF